MKSTTINRETEQLIRQKIQENFENGRGIYKLFYRIGYNATSDYNNASDIAGIAILKMWRSAGTYCFPVDRNMPFLEDNRMRRWAWQIGKNTAVDFFRWGSYFERKYQICQNDFMEIKFGSRISSMEDNPLSRAIEREDLEIAKKVIDEQILGLPEKFRTVLMMSYFEEKKYREIAKELNIPIGTVKSRLNNAKIKLMGGLMEIYNYLRE